jgi:hypothetical protein
MSSSRSPNHSSSFLIAANGRSDSRGLASCGDSGANSGNYSLPWALSAEPDAENIDIIWKTIADLDTRIEWLGNNTPPKDNRMDMLCIAAEKQHLLQNKYLKNQQSLIFKNNQVLRKKGASILCDLRWVRERLQQALLVRDDVERFRLAMRPFVDSNEQYSKPGQRSSQRKHQCPRKARSA